MGKTGQSNRPRFNFFYLMMIFWIMILFHDLFNIQEMGKNIPYGQFIQLLEKGQITEVLIGKETIQGKLKGRPQSTKKNLQNFTTLLVPDNQLTERLIEAKIPFSAQYENTFWKEILSWLFPLILIITLWSFVFSRMGGAAKSPFLSLGKAKVRVYAEKDLKTRFTDVAGIEEAKADLEEVVEFLKNPTQYSRLGGRMPKGILLVGPPGTGKTLLARAVAGEAKVPFFPINGSEFVEMFVGLGAARVRDLFSQARNSAPCIIFIDELDALGRARGLNSLTGSSNDEKEQTLNQLLAELDGFDISTGVVLLGATNRPEVLDPALLRAGRFDRQILVDRPDRKGRSEILKIHMKNISVALEVDPEIVATLTTGFSGADLANLVNEAALVATRRSGQQVEMKDFTEAIERIIAGPERKNRLLGEHERKRVAYHEMGHATVALASERAEVIHKVTIIPRGIGTLGYTFGRPIEDRYLMERQELKNKISMLLGGRAAEIIYFEDISTGAADDLDKATEMARAMITRYGMNDKVGLATYEKESSSFLTGLPSLHEHHYSDHTAQIIDEEVQTELQNSLAMAKNCLLQNEGFFLESVSLLLQQETLDESLIKCLWQKWKSHAFNLPSPSVRQI